MGQGFALHIGLNAVDASKYNGWDGKLSGCVNDANAMQAICKSQGFTTQSLLNNEANADAILGAIGQVAYNLQSGDTFVISYSGHGSQVPDSTGDSPNGLDSTWVVYDRMLLGHELFNLWGQFKAGIRIEVYSDSCHSGTVIRDLLLPDGTLRWLTTHKGPVPTFPSDIGMKKFKAIFAGGGSLINRTQEKAIVAKLSRAMPTALAFDLFERDRTMYQARQWSRKRAAITASVILISGCQDNQESQDGATNGLFTEKLLGVWNNGAFAGTLPQFHQAIVALMPSDQTPNYFTLGVAEETFTNSRPLTIVAASTSTVDSTASASPVNSTTSTTPSTVPTPDSTTTVVQPPSVTGPAQLSRDTDGPPAFSISLGSNPYYVFEITSDTENFGNVANRTSGNFYASWYDVNVPARYTDKAYTLPSSAWEALKGNDKLYYRVGSTTSQAAAEWKNYLVSTTDGDAATSAPAIVILGAKSAPFGA